MDRDCHFYMTYLAAREAGFNHPDANQISVAAQYVDDCDETFVYQTSTAKQVFTLNIAEHIKHQVVKVKPEGGNNFEFYPILTGLGNTWTGTTGEEGNRQVWVPFHFLPGNFKLPTKSRPDCDMHEVRDLQGVDLSQWPSEAKTFMNFLCRPNSPIATDAARSMVDNYGKLEHHARTVALHHLGVVMHVLADTFAHRDFAGTPLKMVNDVEGGDKNSEFTTEGVWKNEHWIIDEKKWKKIDWYVATRNLFSDYICRYAPRISKIAFLGHGQAGHLPDTSCIAFKLKRAWSTVPVLSNNPETYLQAFMNMTTALRCARQGSTYTPLSKTQISEFFRKNFPVCDLVRKALIPDIGIKGKLYSKGLRVEVKDYFRPMEDHWKELISKKYSEVEPIKKYEMIREKWRSEFLKLVAAKEVPIGSIRSDGFFSFNCAAKLHYRFVYNTLHGTYKDMAFQLDKFEKYYDPQLSMLDDVIAAFSGSGSPSLEAWVIGAFPYFTRAMEAATKPGEIIGLEFVKDAVVNAAHVKAALDGLTEWIANEHSKEEMLYRLFGNVRIRKELEELHYFLTKEVANPSAPTTRQRSNAVTEPPPFLRSASSGRPRSNAVTGPPSHAVTRPRSNAVTELPSGPVSRTHGKS